MPDDSPLFWVEVLDGERIAPRGPQRTQWFVRHNDGWMAAQRLPSALCEKQDSAPGTVWQIRVQLRLSIGTALMRVDTQPAAHRSRDAFAHLTRAAPGPERSVRRVY